MRTDVLDFPHEVVELRNTKRDQLSQRLEHVETGQVPGSQLTTGTLIIEPPELRSTPVRTAAVRTPGNKQLEPVEELVQDLLTIVTVFAGRLYGHRAKGMRKRVRVALQACATAEQETEDLHGTGQKNYQTPP